MAKKRNSLEIALEAMIATMGQQYSEVKQKIQDTD